MTDRRRINGPAEGTTPPVFLTSSTHKPVIKRSPTTLRKIFLKTSLTPPATGSAFLELPTPSNPSTPTLKLTASVYGPRPLPSSTTFSPDARLTAELKFSPFSTPGHRRGYIRDGVERDLSAQLSIALEKSVDVGKYPKSAIDVFVSVLDCEGGLGDAGDGNDGGVEVGLMGVVAGAISCASAAIADAGIECFDLVAGGVAGLIRERGGVVEEDHVGEGMEAGEDISGARHGEKKNRGIALVLDPSPTDGYIILAAAAVGYMAARDELTLVWTKGSMGREGDGTDEVERLVDGAIAAATSVRLVINEAVKERLLLGLKEIGLIKEKAGGNDGDIVME
ncbi:3' exoribonuclease family, domain 1-domain-containing protein [Tuber borchii]|uniref:3' exoribonuclease family, domain 1-domain-containing protein n=1 Tax=Tuber borchii TaxID=42251 RepID=A0A2T7A8Q4_TUBBO|nr:3' exoribonuclease family, domain 1-domain-containing protein [Tuber borchii]